MFNEAFEAFWMICSCVALGAAMHTIGKRHKSWSFRDKLRTVLAATVLGPITLGFILAELTEKEE